LAAVAGRFNEIGDFNRLEAMSENQKQDDWTTCPPGEITQMVNRLESQRRSVATVKTIGAAAVIMLGVAIWQFSGATNPGENNLGHIACHEVCSHCEDYQDGTLAKSDPTLLARIEQHLGHCKSCSAKLKPNKPLAALRLPSAIGTPHGFNQASIARR
jgi:hypothetical protein